MHSPDTPIAVLRESMASRVARLAKDGGLHQHPALPGLRLFRADAMNGSVCGTYEPCVALILQGSKQVVMGSDTFVYDNSHFLIASLQLPAVATILEASPERPYLALVLALDLREIATLMLDGQVPAEAGRARAEMGDLRAMATGAVTLPLLDAFRRLLDLLEQPGDLAVLGPLVQREIFYRLLVGEQGARLRQIAAVGSQGHQISRAVDALQTRFTEPLRVEELAREVRMSLSTFHHHFKLLTSMSPLQYQKQLRLAEARRLMLAENLDAATAAYRVGYESPSQFSREYSRHFGAPPMRDMAGLRAAQPETASA